MMYLFETGFGQTSKAPAKWPFKEGRFVKDGHSAECHQTPGEPACSLALNVKFRRSFNALLREVENAIGRFIEWQRPAAWIRYWIRHELQISHEKFLKQGMRDNDLIVYSIVIGYSLSKGRWIVNAILVGDSWSGLIDL